MVRLADPASESDSGSDSDRKKVLQAIAKMSKNDLIQIRKEHSRGYKGRDCTSCRRSDSDQNRKSSVDSRKNRKYNVGGSKIPSQ